MPIPRFEVATRVNRFEVPDAFTFVVKILETRSVEVLEVPEIFTLVVKILEAVRAFVKYALPRMYRFAPAGVVPIPMPEVATRVKVLVVVAFTFVVNIFDAEIAFVA